MFLFLKVIKKIIDLKSKTKYTSQKQLVQQQKLPITKLYKKKRKKKAQSTNFTHYTHTHTHKTLKG